MVARWCVALQAVYRRDCCKRGEKPLRGTEHKSKRQTGEWFFWKRKSGQKVLMDNEMIRTSHSEAGKAFQEVNGMC